MREARSRLRREVASDVRHRRHWRRDGIGVDLNRALIRVQGDRRRHQIASVRVGGVDAAAEVIAAVPIVANDLEEEARIVLRRQHEGTNDIDGRAAGVDAELANGGREPRGDREAAGTVQVVGHERRRRGGARAQKHHGNNQTEAKSLHF